MNPLIHNKLDELQFNSTLEKGRFLIIKIPYVGYGGQLSIRILGMKFAFIFNRTVIFDNSNNPYLNCYEPTSKFSIKDIENLPSVKLDLSKNQEDSVVYLDFNEYWINLKNRRYFEEWVPQELSGEYKNKDYFTGQLLLRFKLLPKYKEYIEETKKRLGFSKPILGMHIRRGDKRNESPYVPIRIYNFFLKKAVQQSGIKKIFVTSDNDEVFAELPQDLGLEYIYDTAEKRYNNANHEFLTENPDLKEQETLTAIKIIELLSDCESIIGQINTHFTTLSYGLSSVKNKNKTKIYFVNKDINDIYINNDPNIFLLIIDVLRKYMHMLLVFIVRKIKPFIFFNEKFYRKIKDLYYKNINNS